MKLIVNGNDIDITLENERTVGEVLKAFEEEAAKNEATTVSISIDGKNISAQEFDEAIMQPLKEDTLIELSVVSKADIRAAFSASKEKFAELSESLKNVSVLLQSGKDGEANATIAVLAGEIDRLCHTATLGALFPEEFQKLLVNGMDVGSFFEEFAPVLKDFEDALSAKDTVTIGDLAEYEISPRLRNIADAIEVLLK